MPNKPKDATLAIVSSRAQIAEAHVGALVKQITAQAMMIEDIHRLRERSPQEDIIKLASLVTQLTTASARLDVTRSIIALATSR